MGLTEASPAQFATPIRFHVPGADWIYAPKRTVQLLKRFRDKGFTDFEYAVHPGLIHETDHQRIWMNRFLEEMQGKNPAREDRLSA
jgi:hypothetical protein